MSMPGIDGLSLQMIMTSSDSVPDAPREQTKPDCRLGKIGADDATFIGEPGETSRTFVTGSPSNRLRLKYLVTRDVDRVEWNRV